MASVREWSAGSATNQPQCNESRDEGGDDDEGDDCHWRSATGRRRLDGLGCRWRRRWGERRHVGGEGLDEVDDAVAVLVVAAGWPLVVRGGGEPMDHLH